MVMLWGASGAAELRCRWLPRTLGWGFFFFFSPFPPIPDGFQRGRDLSRSLRRHQEVGAKTPEGALRVPSLDAEGAALGRAALLVFSFAMKHL